jgi:hypothetical protein
MSGQASPVRVERSLSLVHVNADTVARMERLVSGKTDEALNARFGISYNTWRKLTAGQPVRASLADRLMARLSTLESTDSGRQMTAR